MTIALASAAVKASNIGFKTFVFTNLLAADGDFNSSFGAVPSSASRWLSAACFSQP